MWSLFRSTDVAPRAHVWTRPAACGRVADMVPQHGTACCRGHFERRSRQRGPGDHVMNTAENDNGLGRRELLQQGALAGLGFGMGSRAAWAQPAGSNTP